MTPLAERRIALALLAVALLTGTLGTLIGGLAGAALRSGRLNPLDWGLPMILGLMLPGAWLWWRRTRLGPVRSWALAAALTLPPIALVALAGSRPAPWSALTLVLLGLGVVALLNAALAVRRGVPAGQMLALALAAALAALGLSAWADRPRPEPDGEVQVVTILSALPLHGARTDLALPESAGVEPAVPRLAAPAGRSILDAALMPSIQLRPIESVDQTSLRGVTTLLLAQPRALAPAELVAIDSWVRTGGRIIILADPALLWEGAFPLGHPLAAPRASLLSPLLRHWGLDLLDAPPTGDDPVVRHILAEGALLQLAAPGRLRARPPTVAETRCAVAEAGLLARCTIGRGQAVVMADADWINPDLWTLAPQDPRNRRSWTADSPDVLTALLHPMPGTRPLTDAGFLADVGALVLALRWAALLAMALAFMIWVMIRQRFDVEKADIPTRAHGQINTKEEQTAGGMTI